MMEPENRKKPGAVSLDPKVKEGIQELAKKDDRTFSAFVNIVLRNYLEDQSKKKLVKRGM